MDVVLAMESATLLALCDVDAPSDGQAMAVAARFVAEWRLHVWTHAANRKGVAPPTGSLLDRYEEHRQEFPEPIRPDEWGNVSSFAARMLAVRWRKRWSGRVARIRTQDVVPVEELRQKACVA